MVKVGSIWRSAEDRQFMVIGVVEAEGHTWIHYREHAAKKPVIECREYSCYEESFVTRFSESPE
jgi:hypothetical protein